MANTTSSKTKFSNYIKTITKSKKIIDGLIAAITKTSDPKLDKQLQILKELSASLDGEITFFDSVNKEQDKVRQTNVQYKTLIDKRIEDISKECEIINSYVSPKKPYEIEDRFLSDLKNMIGKQSDLLIFDQFKYGDSNYILFGKNGSGKTTILNMLAQRMFATNAVVIRATRNINYEQDSLVHPHNVSLKGAIENTNENTMAILSKLVLQREVEQRRAGVDESLVITKKISEIFDSLGIDRDFNVASNGALELSVNGLKPYSLSKGSDGEKSVVFIVMMILLAPPDSFLFIDEPENHLNGSLMKKLFDRLEAERKDLVFVYATHNTNFIETRANAELVYLQKTDDSDSWSFVKYDNYKKLPLDIILNVDGINDNVIFCEGECQNSYDYKLLCLLFPQYQIIPSQGCSKVVLQTFIFNDNSSLLRKKAFGVVDYDFRSPEEISDLNKQSVYVLGVNEIENVFISEECLAEMINFTSLQKTIDSIKGDVIRIVSERKTAIQKDYATKLFRTLHSKNKLTGVENVENEIDRLNAENKKSFMFQYNLFCLGLTNSINNNNYDEIMKLVPGKMIINEVAKMFGYINKDEYIRQIFIRIENNNKVLDKLKKLILIPE